MPFGWNSFIDEVNLKLLTFVNLSRRYYFSFFTRSESEKIFIWILVALKAVF